jgi:DNA-binding XRE family transcriptional regulator
MRAGKAGQPRAKPRASTSPYAHGRSETRTRAHAQDALEREQVRLGRYLLGLRVARGLSQEAAAELAGVHEKYLSKLERGLANPTLSTLLGVATAYRVPLSSCFER